MYFMLRGGSGEIGYFNRSRIFCSLTLYRDSEASSERIETGARLQGRAHGHLGFAVLCDLEQMI